MCNIPELSTVSSLADTIKELFELGISSIFPMVDRLLRLVVALPVSTATVERVFSGVKLCKTRTLNKMWDDYLRSYVTIYIEKKLAAKISSLDIMEPFDQHGPRRGKFKLIEM
jgi:hypothetical protein